MRRSRRQIQGRLGEKEALRLLAQRLWAIRFPIMSGIVLTLLLTGINLGYGMVAKNFLDAVTKPDGGLTAGLLNYYALLALGVGVVRNLCGIVNGYSWGYASQKLARELRDEVFTALQWKSLSFMDRKKTGQILSVLNNDVNGTGALLDVIQDLISAPFFLVGGVVLLFWLSWPLALVSTVCLPLAGLVIAWATRRTREYVARVQAGRADVVDVAQESLSAMRVVKSFTNEEFEIRRFRYQNDRVFRLLLQTMRVRLTMRPVVEFLGMGAVLIVLWVGGLQIVHGGGLTFGSLAWFVLILKRVASSVQDMGRISLTLTSAAVSADRVFTVVNAPNELQESPDAGELPDGPGRVVFDNVTFAYSSGVPVLEGVSFTMEPGEVVALVGPTGAGKTTMASLIPRFYEISDGAIRIDGVDIREVTRKSLRRKIGLVLQDTILFAGTIRDNIAYGRLDASDDDIIAAAKAANAWEFIEKLPRGLQTRVSERGVSLSGGQRQRIAIARAILRGSRILILDEATSSLDVRAEALVQEALQNLVKERTTLVIAHRLSTIRNADKILVLKEGHIVECGRHEELLAQDGVYADLYRTQFRDQERRPLDAPEAEQVAEADESAPVLAGS